MSFFQRLLTSQAKRLNADSALWAFPGLVGLGWFLWPALDYEWKMEMGWAPDPEAGVNRVHNAKLARMEAAVQNAAKQGGSVSSSSGIALTGASAAKEEREEEEVASEEEEDVPAMEDGDDNDSSDDEEEEEQEIKIKPLYLPTKADKLTPQEIWDNFTVKALNMSEDDDDDDEDEEEEEGTCVHACVCATHQCAMDSRANG